MQFSDLRQLRQTGAAIADEHRDRTRLLVLVYCGVAAALSLGSNGLQFLLDDRISGTGGLGGLGMRSVLQTIQEILYYINLLFGPFWTAGFLGAMLHMVRGRSPEVHDLTGGFRRFGKVLAHMAFHFLVMFALLMATSNLATLIYTMTPMSADLIEALKPLLEDPNVLSPEGVLNVEQLPLDQLLSAMLPLLILSMVLFLICYTYVSYCFRLSLYLVMDRPIGGVRACFESQKLMRGHKWQMLKLDLGYWWYYLLMALAMAVGYLDLILSLLGVSLPLDPRVMFFGTLGAYFVLNLLLSLWMKCRVDAAYILAYEAITNHEPTEEMHV